MKVVLFLIDTLQTGGAEKSLLDIASRFKRYRPVFFQLFPGDALHPDFRRAGIEIVEFGLSPSYKFRSISSKIHPAVVKLNPALIHSTLFRADMVSRHLGHSLGVPLINSFVNNSYSKQRFQKLAVLGKLKLLGIQLWDRSTAHHVDWFISNSLAIKKTNARALHIDERLVQVIYRGRDVSQFNDVEPGLVARVKTSLGLENKRVILNVSRLLERKGQLDLIRAFEAIRHECRDLILLIAGEGGYRSLLEREIKYLGLEQSVRLLGNRADIPVLMKLANLFVFPSHFEGLPGVLIEAMFSRVPAVISNIPENLECLDASSAWVFPVGDSRAMGSAILTALAASDRSQRIENAYARAIGNFDIDQIAASYESAYDALLANQENI